jgi:isoquinoline 1-oxidoreductase
MTSLAQMAAEELDAPLSSMRAVMGDTGVCPVDTDGGTWGSLTTRNFGPVLRSAAAQARGVLLALASEQWGIPQADLFTQDGFVISRTDPNQRVSYATLAGGKSVEATLSPTPRPKAFAQFTLSGQPVRRIDAVEKVTGQAKYTADIQLPGMLYARILRPPAHGAKLQSIDTTAAAKLPGVTVKQVNGQWVVLHEKPDVAGEALDVIARTAVWELPQSGPNNETIHEYLVSRYPSGSVFRQRGSLATGESLATLKAESTYTTPYVAHAAIEPHAAVAAVEGGKVTVWASTQAPYQTRSETGAARVITPYVGGGFGGKAANPQAIEAAQIARSINQTVHLAWTREEEFFYDTFQPPSITKIRAGLDNNRRISFWDARIYCVGDRGAALFYDIPHYRILTFGTYSSQGPHPFKLGPWRAPGNNANTFARESHIDTLANLAGVDPLQFRLQHLKDARMRKVLEQAAAHFSWPASSPPGGRGYGLACGEDAGAYVVMMAEVEVDTNTGQVQVKRILCAQDMGQVINPAGARRQMEGCMMMGMGYALAEEILFSQGTIRTRNFHNYSLPKFSWMPQLETLIVENNALSPQGGGEPSIITMGAVLANAVAAAIGVRPNRLPLTPARVKALMQPPTPPVLNSPQRADSGIRLSWIGGPGIKLQKTASLTPPAWQDVPGTEGQSQMDLPVAEAASFFRLIKP